MKNKFNNMPENPKEGDLLVWWATRIPTTERETFWWPVTTPTEGGILLDALANYNLHIVEVGFMLDPDANAGGLFIFEDGEWVDWESEDGEGIDVYMEVYRG